MCSWVLVVQKVLIGEMIVRHSDTEASPAELVLHYPCLNTSCVDLHQDTRNDAAIFPSDTKYVSW